MRRRGGGIAAIQRKQQANETIRQVGEQMEEMEIEALGKQMEVFKEQLERFATQHANDIKKNPQFRAHFQRMCAQVGVDPLASRKGFWAEMLGVGDFYFELGVQVVEACLITRAANGGLIDMDDLLRRVMSRRARGSQTPSLDDLERAVKKLHVLGNGFDIIQVGSRKLCQSVPVELNKDHSVALSSAAATAYTSVSKLEADLQWDRTRGQHVLEHLVKEGMAWVDDHGAERDYWFPALWKTELVLS